MSAIADAGFLSGVRDEMRELRAAMPGCCVRCAMRFAGVRDSAAYTLPEEELEEAIAVEESKASGGALDIADSTDAPSANADEGAQVCSWRVMSSTIGTLVPAVGEAYLFFATRHLRSHAPCPHGRCLVWFPCA